MLQITISKRAAFIALLAVLMIIPVAAYAGSVFDDVDDTATHIDGITFMKDSGVSVGCGGNDYCPSDNVTRAQMGTFMYRMSGNDPATSPSVNAGTVDGLDSTDLQSAAYSTFVDGPVETDFNNREVLSLDVPAGSYVFIATAWINHGSGVELLAECTLTADGDFDQARAGLGVGDTQTVTMTVVDTLASSGTAVLTCNELAFNADLDVYDAKITAIQVHSLSNVGG